MPVMDVSAAFDGFEMALIRKRVALGTTSAAGVYVPGSQTLVTVTAVVYPLSGEDLQRLPEGVDVGDAIGLVSRSDLSAGSDSYHPDEVQYEGRWYEIHAVEPWKQLGDFVVAYATRKDEA